VIIFGACAPDAPFVNAADAGKPASSSVIQVGVRRGTVLEDAFYGWPYAFTGQNPQPGFAHLRSDKVQASVPPDL
jgi:hypothetical protein